MSIDCIELADLHSVPDYAARFPNQLSVDTLRYLLRNRDTNGLARACVPLGKKLLISHTRFQEWLATRAAGGAAQ